MRHIHIIGIGGTFMGGIGALAKAAGFRVTGCDAQIYPPMSTQLEALGINAHEGFDAEQLNQFAADVYIIGNVAKRGMPIVEAVLNRNLPYTSGPQWLSENILHRYRVLGVAGTHGKTTTASMLAWILEFAGLSPGFLIGGIPQNFGISARLPQKPNNRAFFVIEADEYDTAFFDKRSKFVHYRPDTVILNNLEFDHADIFNDIGAIQTQFHHLIRTIPSNGLIVCNAAEPNLRDTLKLGCWTPTETFGTANGWQAADTAADGSFNILRQGKPVGRVVWDITGGHNRMNALAAIAAAHHAGIGIETACQALNTFKNVKRRMEIKGSVNGITIYDDFAHHPTAIAATIAGLHQKIGTARLVAVLEPRSNTMKLGTMKTVLAASLQEADSVFCYSGGVDWNVAAALAPLGSKVHIDRNLNTFTAAIAASARHGDHILIMSNGSFGNIHNQLLTALGGQHQNSDTAASTCNLND